MEHRNFIMFCQQDWDVGIGTNARSLAKELSKSNQVLYVNLPLDINSLLSRFKQPDIKARLRIVLGQEQGLKKVGHTLWVYTPGVLSLSINWLSSRWLFTILNRFNSYLLARSIRKAARSVGFETFILFQDGLIFQGLELKRLLKPSQFIYYVRDNMVSVPYFQRHGPHVERGLFEHADVVVANSAYLNDYARQTNPNSFDIGQGCTAAESLPNLQPTIPADMAAIPGFRIGYTGFLTDLRLDIDLLLSIARYRPDWSLVLVGPEDKAFMQSALHELPNVYFLGSKQPDQLSDYIAHFDVCINPQVVNPMTIGNYPLKIDEYLIMGKPVVATHTRTMEMFQPNVYLADSVNKWLELLETALKDKDALRAQARMQFARSHTWSTSAAKFYHALEHTNQL
jgi:teichuronic acid biosynthesis glycosyltransferase TuaH